MTHLIDDVCDDNGLVVLRLLNSLLNKAIVMLRTHL